MLKLTRLTLLAGGLLLAALSAFAQSNATGRISGAVVSSDNQALPGVTVSLFSPALQGVRTATTSANGDYIFTFLPAGDYEVAFDLTGFQGVKQRVRVALAENVPLNATLGVATVQESLVVEAEAGSGDFAQTAPVASSYKQELVDKLPIDRTLDKIALLSPGVQATGPAVGSGARATAGIVISGANSFDSLFLINGVVVNENLRGQSLDLFIEDAIQETTTTTAAVSAEFGRFAGGVVQAVTKSGGNLWNGSFRVTFDNDSWRDTTPFGEPKLDKTVPRYEATVGGPILRDRLWLFGAARLVNDEVANQTRFTNIAYTQPDRERRYEGKLTYSINANHSVKGSYTKITRDRQNTAFSTIMDEASLYDRSDPQDLLSLNYTGILSSKFFVEGQYSRRRLTFEGSGSRFTDLIKGTLLLDRQRNSARYNAPTFCAVCGPPETRDNDDILVKATYFLSTKGAGSHTLVAGFDTFADKRFANNHQSGSDYRIFGTTSIIRGTEIFPVFNNDTTTFIRWNPIFTESEGNVFRTNSAFLNDTWRLGNKLTFNLGVRFDQNDGQDAAGATVVKDSAFSPRLAVTYDPTGDGLWTLNAGYGKYVAGLNNAQGDSATAGGNPSRIDFNYLGPAINTNPNAPLLTSAQALEALFNWFNSNGGTSRPVRGTTDVSGVNAGIGDRLASPHAREVTLGVTRRLGNRGLVRLDGVYREFRDFYSNRTDRSTGQVTDPRFGRRLDFTVVENTNEESRRYKGLNAQVSYRVTDRLLLSGNYTLSRTRGTFDGENRTSGSLASLRDNYPEYIEPRWNTPEGDLSNDRRHRARLWATYDLPLPTRAGRMSLGVLQFIDSGLPYGALGLVAPAAFVTNPGYATPPAQVDYFYTARDAFRTESVKRTDVNLNYAFKLKSRAELFFRGTVLNLFNGTAVADNNTNRINLSVLSRVNSAAYQAFNPFTTTPVQGVHWALGTSALPDGRTANFGEPISRDAYQFPRTFNFSVGLRF